MRTEENKIYNIESNRIDFFNRESNTIESWIEKNNGIALRIKYNRTFNGELVKENQLEPSTSNLTE